MYVWQVSPGVLRLQSHVPPGGDSPFRRERVISTVHYTAACDYCHDTVWRGNFCWVSTLTLAAHADTIKWTKLPTTVYYRLVAVH